MIARELQRVEWSGTTPDPAYLRFSDSDVDQTVIYGNGEVTVDLDQHGDVIGIEMLSTDSEEWETVAQIGKAHDLRFDLLLAAAANATPA